jgi:hypothetical protein
MHRPSAPRPGPSPVPIGYDAGSVPEPVLTLVRKRFLDYQDWNTDPSVFAIPSLVPVPVQYESEICLLAGRVIVLLIVTCGQALGPLGA